MFTTKVQLFEMLYDPKSNLHAARLQIPVKIYYKDRVDNHLLDDASEEYGMMHLGVLHYFQGDQVLEVTHTGNDFLGPDKDCPLLLRHQVVW